MRVTLFTGASHFAGGMDMVLYSSMGTFYIIFYPHVKTFSEDSWSWNGEPCGERV
jgi:hypothetical protein